MTGGTKGEALEPFGGGAALYQNHMTKTNHFNLLISPELLNSLQNLFLTTK